VLSIRRTRSRAYKKNDQAWIEQKNGTVVRRFVGYGRLEGQQAAAVLDELHAKVRLYVSFFLPSFKLRAKPRLSEKREQVTPQRPQTTGIPNAAR